MIVSLLLMASMVFAYNVNSKLEASNLQVEKLTGQLANQKSDNDALKVEVSNLTEEGATVKRELQNKRDALKKIDDKLQAEGEILEEIDELLSENNKMKNELDGSLLKLTMLEEENAKKTEDFLLNDTQQKQWDKDIKAIQVLLKKRTTEMADIISNMSSLSIESIMVNQEIEFLEKIHSDVEDLKKMIEKISVSSS